MSHAAVGKRPAESRLDESERDRLRAEGWRFSTEAVPEEPVDPLHLVCRSGSLATSEVLATLENGASAETKMRACMAIAKLAEKDQGRDLVLSKFGADAVVRAINVSIEHNGVAANGCSALANLALGQGAPAVLKAQGAEAAVAVMAAHAGCAAVQAAGCLALGNMCFDSEGEGRVLAAGGVRALSRALQGAATDAAVAEEVCDCIVNLAGSAVGLSALDACPHWVSITGAAEGRCEGAGARSGDGSGGGSGDGSGDGSGAGSGAGSGDGETEGGTARADGSGRGVEPTQPSPGLAGLIAALDPLLAAHPSCGSVRECLVCLQDAAASRRAVVARYTDVAPQIDGATADPAWARAEVVVLRSFHPRSSEHQPRVEARLLHDDHHLYVRFDVLDDQQVRGRQQVTNGAVHLDSCVECFLQRRCGGPYLNVEMNCIGVVHLGRHLKPRQGVVEDPARWEGRLERWTSLMERAAELAAADAAGPLSWSTTMALPLALLYELLAPRPGEPSEDSTAAEAPGGGDGPTGRPPSPWRIGLFKCADDSSTPHWGSAFPIGDELNFHQPQCFGELRLEPKI